MKRTLTILLANIIHKNGVE